ncbi:MAG: DUF4238 domain-containing protein [Actinomycetota bacterium]|nr:DUF4238 domain-containing protein [Actinomycetota bacterium]
MAVGAAPFGEMPSNQEILRRVRALVPEAGQNEPDQHVVAQVILKQFTRPWRKKGELLLASLDVRHPDRKLIRRGPASFGKIPNYLRFASSSAEDLWGATETRLHDPLEAVRRDGRIADPAHEAVIRDAIALHFIRSIPTAALHRVTWRERRESARQQWRDSPRMLQQIHVSAFGWWTDDPARLELALDEFYRPVDELVASDAVFRVSLKDRFRRLRAGFQAFGLKVLAAPDREFLIGDVPVLALREGHGGLGIFDGVGVANADEIVLPLTPHHVAVLGQGDESRRATAGEVDRYNMLEVRLAYRHVYMRPAGDLAPYARSLLGTEAAA